MRRGFTAAGLLVLVTAALFASVGHAAGGSTYTVLAGENAPIASPKMTTLNAFFPAKLDVHLGDSVTFQSAGFHTVAYIPGKLPGVVAPGQGKLEGIVDAAGDPFWFDGQARLAYNPQVFGPIPAKEVVKGAPVASGVLSPAGPKACSASGMPSWMECSITRSASDGSWRIAASPESASVSSTRAIPSPTRSVRGALPDGARVRQLSTTRSRVVATVRACR